jgi:acyl-coenzyme A synthetase/AMP-(fatty) acid ligase
MSLFKDIDKFESRVAVISDTGKSYLYNDLKKYIDEISVKLCKRSIVFALCNNEIGSLCGYLSFINNGVVPLMLDSSIDKTFLEDLISIYKPEYLWIPKRREQELNYGNIIFRILDYSLISVRTGEHSSLNSDLAILLTTSGSTGSPKLVRLSYKNIVANARSIVEYLGIDGNERPITTLPMYYSFGLSIINSHLIQGSTILLTSKTLMERSFWSFMKENNATSISGVPYTYEMFSKLRFFRMDLPSLKTMTQAGGKLNNDLNKKFAEYCVSTGRKFYVMYGQTEATARMSYLPPQYSIEKIGSMGIAIPGGEFSIIDDSGSLISNHDTVGELVYRGDNVSLGYAECLNDLGKEDENKGVLITGDMAKRDTEGFYYIVGRKKRFIKMFGNRLNLDETERLLKNIVTDCACTGKDDYLLIYITEDNRIQEVTKFILTKIKINPSAFSIKLISEIPKNSSGKTIYTSLQL